MAGQLGVQEEIPAASGLVIVSLDLRRLPLPCGQWLPLALRLEALPLSVGSFFPCCCWSGDMVFSLRDGRASASRRSKNHSCLRVDASAIPPITSSLAGKNHASLRARELALPAPVLFRPLLPMRLRTTQFCRVKATERQLLLKFSRASARWDAPELLNSCASLTLP